MRATAMQKIDPAKSRSNIRLTTFVHALVFVSGFSLVFIIGWGGMATVFGKLFGQYKTQLGQVGGLVVILFGLSTIGLINIPWINYDTRPGWTPSKRNSLLSSGAMGVFFAAGWSPCIGTTLGAILTLGFSAQTSNQAMILSSGYALGLGIPFLLLGIGMGQAMKFLNKFRRYQRPFQIASGILIILIGLLLVSGRLTMIAVWAQSNGYYLELPYAGAATPTYPIAILAGLLSFLSPCVLPLVPAYIGYLSGQTANSKKVLLQE
jgi:cytochrome c-type biogenesis protein